jgi:hypothetical protein
MAFVQDHKESISLEAENDKLTGTIAVLRTLSHVNQDLLDISVKKVSQQESVITSLMTELAEAKRTIENLRPYEAGIDNLANLVDVDAKELLDEISLQIDKAFETEQKAFNLTKTKSNDRNKSNRKSNNKGNSKGNNRYF